MVNYLPLKNASKKGGALMNKFLPQRNCWCYKCSYTSMEMHTSYHHSRGFHHHHHRQHPEPQPMTCWQVLQLQPAVEAQTQITDWMRHRHYLAGTDSTHWRSSVDLQAQSASIQPATGLVLLHGSTLTRGQSNLTKIASRGAHSPVRGHPRGSKVVPLNSWGRVSY